MQRSVVFKSSDSWTKSRKLRDTASGKKFETKRNGSFLYGGDPVTGAWMGTHYKYALEKKKQPPYVYQKATLGALGFCTFYLFTCFSTLIIFFIAKIPRFISKQKNQSCEKNFGQVHSGWFFIFMFFFGFVVVPSLTVSSKVHIPYYILAYSPRQT